MAGKFRSAAAAVFVGPAAASITLSAGTWLSNMMGGQQLSADAGAAYVAFFLVNFAPSLIVAASAGLAWHKFAMSRGWRSAAAYCLPGGAVGAALASAVLFASSVASGEFEFRALFRSVPLFMIIYGFGLGALTGLFAWIVRRPDRDTPLSVIPDSAAR